MRILSTFLICTLLLLVVVPVPVFAGGFLAPASVAPDSGIHALSGYPAVTPTPKPELKNPYLVATVTTTPQPVGILMLDSIPAGASVYVDGSLKGTTFLSISPITPGVHTVSFTLAGYKDYTTTVTVPAGNVGKLVATMVPVTPGAVTSTGPPSISGSTPVPVTSGMRSAIPTGRTDPVPVTPVTQQVSQQVTIKPAVTCTKHYFGTGGVETAPDGRLNCTTLISSDDQIVILAIPEGTRVTDAGKRPVPEIRITPVNLQEIPSNAGPDGSRWTGRAYLFLPDHTSFDPPVLVSFTLSQGEWDRSDPANLTIQETAETGPGWESLPTAIDPVTRTISAPAHHFSTIGLFSTNPAGTPPVTGQSPVDLIRTATGSSHGPLPVSPLLPDTIAPLAAVAAGVAISIAGTLAGGSMIVSQWWSKLIGLIQKFLGAEAFGLLSSTEIEKRSLRPADNLSAVLLGLSSREILVIGLSTIGFAAAFILQDRLELKLTTVIIFVCVAGIATILHDLAHKYGAYRAGCITEYQFWSLGTVTMLATAWLFGNAFAKPSRTLIRSERILLPETAAIIKLAGPVMSMGIAILSLFLIPLGGLFVVAGSAGFTMNLLNCVFSLVPVKPNDGVEIYAWNKLIWACVFIPLMAFYLWIYILL